MTPSKSANVAKMPAKAFDIVSPRVVLAIMKLKELKIQARLKLRFYLLGWTVGT